MNDRARAIGICWLVGASAFAQSGAPQQLTLTDATAMALKNHPRVQAAQNETSAQSQRIVEARSAYYPSINGEVTGSGANIGSRLGAGYMSASRLFNRVGDGIQINQLITDFGRTQNLVAQSRLQAGASQQDYQAARYDVVLGVNEAYYETLRAQALVKVAQKTVEARQSLSTQVGELAKNNLRSLLDVKFAEVTVAKAQLLIIQTQNAVTSAFAQLARALGTQQTAVYQLVDEPMPQSPPADVEPLVVQALQSRPELASYRLTRDAAYRFVRAEHDLKLPTAAFAGVAGYLPYVDQITLPRVIPGEYAGAAVNVQIPIFNGKLFSAREQEAHYRALEADQKLRDLEEGVARDVRTAWANAQTAYQNIDVTAKYLDEATEALGLSQERFRLGLADIVALTDAELNATEAQIANLNAKYDYQSLNAVLQYSIGALK
jgi:outer membrane protein